MWGSVNAAELELHLIVVPPALRSTVKGALQRVLDTETGYFSLSWTFAREDSSRWRLAT